MVESMESKSVDLVDRRIDYDYEKNSFESDYQ